MDSTGGNVFLRRQYQAYTRYLRPVRTIHFTDLEMLQAMIQVLDPEEISSASQLLGPRKGVVRITCKTTDTVERLEQVVKARKLMIHGVPLGLVDETTGQFILVVLDNVPQYVPDEQVDQAMSKYGVVASSSKDYVELNGCRIENERRNVLYTALFNREIINHGQLKLFSTTVFVKAPYLDKVPTAHSAPGYHPEPEPQGDHQGSNEGGTNSSEAKVSHALSAMIENVGGIMDRNSIRPADPYQRSLPQTRQQQMGRYGRAAHRMSYHPGATGELSEMLAGLSGRFSPPNVRSSSQDAETRGGTGPGGPRKSPPVSSEVKQMRKRSQAFEQLAAFLQ